MFKAMIKTISEEVGDQISKVISVQLVTKELFAHHGIGEKRASLSMEFVETHCAELYLVQTDLGFCLIDYDAETYQLVFPALIDNEHSALVYIEETAMEESDGE